ncbi:hypothetical protein [Acidithiobacillus acidisediminis]|uniref:hypothetical protein n=1 Tax=Acidithiobacillus acidisediminis TaxID=2937799 RepID=UPI00200C43D1|nr:hypothetical protein [Acidithiobacillus sp. S30A2]
MSDATTYGHDLRCLSALYFLSFVVTSQTPRPVPRSTGHAIFFKIRTLEARTAKRRAAMQNLHKNIFQLPAITEGSCSGDCMLSIHAKKGSNLEHVAKVADYPDETPSDQPKRTSDSRPGSGAIEDYYSQNNGGTPRSYGQEWCIRIC